VAVRWRPLAAAEQYRNTDERHDHERQPDHSRDALSSTDLTRFPLGNGSFYCLERSGSFLGVDAHKLRALRFCERCREPFDLVLVIGQHVVRVSATLGEGSNGADVMGDVLADLWARRDLDFAIDRDGAKARRSSWCAIEARVVRTRTE
jgi:hypothetical protein